uniref:E3 ubiquitin-protein ligase TRIM37 n=1 Tax=Culex pipiens TaxID=7175 RepID=A0A8D8GGA0_CULPI
MASENSEPATELVRLLECRVCLEGVKNCLICCHCSQPFCQDCIVRWIQENGKCPNCRQNLTCKGSLVKVATFDRIQELLMDESQNRCGQHPKDYLSLYCKLCQQSICARCLHSDQHMEHKDEVVLVDDIYDQSEYRLRYTMVKIERERATTVTLLDGLKDNLKTVTQLLNDDIKVLEGNLSKIDELHHEVEESLNSKKDATTLREMMEILRTAESFNLKQTQVLEKLHFQKSSSPHFVTIKFKVDENDESDNKPVLESLTVNGGSVGR